MPPRTTKRIALLGLAKPESKLPPILIGQFDRPGWELAC
jgi:hypothetical protein